jgi:hypothetical protein
VFQDLGVVPVDLEPRQRFQERASMHQRPPCARRRLEIRQSPLQPENLTEALHVAARQLHPSQQRGWVPFGLAAIFVPAGRTSPGEPLRRQQRAEQHGVGQRVRDVLEAVTIRVERARVRPQRLSAIAHQLGREMVE